MKRIFPLEIRSFHSINELNSFIDDSISWYEGILKDYNQHLGELLRKADGSQDEELLKKLSENMKQDQETKKKSKKDKKSEHSPTENWFSFKGLMFSADNKSMAEIFFEAADIAKKNFERLKEVKVLIEELQKIGFASGLVYQIYFVDGIPQKIRIEKESDAESKYRFEINLSTGTEIEDVKKVEEIPESTVDKQSDGSESQPKAQT